MKKAKPLRSEPFAGAICLLTLLLLLSGFSFAQELPDKIRGYKVHKAELGVNEESGSSDKKAKAVSLELGKPVLADVDLLGVTFNLEGKLLVYGQSGKVDFISFKDFRVNGTRVEIYEYRSGFKFRKNEEVFLPKPVEIFVSLPQSVRAAGKELRDPLDNWEVTGRVFVFGEFRKSVFRFKRVVPLDVRFTIPNPLK